LRWLFLPLVLTASTASALEIGAFNLDGHGMIGSNVVQGTYYGLGVDFYTYVEDRLAVGVGGYYTAGEHPTQDREIGVGPFASYSYPILNFLIASAREDFAYLDERNPFINPATNAWDYQSSYGMASITTVALHLMLSQHFGVSAGYRLAIGLNNSDLSKDHSGFIFGLAFAF
jgi:hypothetical protein